MMICEVHAAQGRPLQTLAAGRQEPQAGSASPAVLLGNLTAGARRRIVELLDSVRMPVVGLGSAEELVDGFPRGTPGCLVIEPGPAGLLLAPWLSAAGPAVPVLCYAEQPRVADAVEAMRAGAWTYLDSTLGDQSLLDEIQHALQEAQRRWSQGTWLRDLRAKFAVLSRRELEVLRWTLEGLSSRRIADQLGIAHRTIDSHRTNSLRKLGVSRFCEVAREFCVLLEYENGGAGDRV